MTSLNAPTAPSEQSTVIRAPHIDGKHIVEILIEERCTKLLSSPLWPLYRSILYPLLKKHAAVKMADAIAPLDATGVFDYLSDLLDLSLTADGTMTIPEKGRVLIASTHPTGIADGVAMWQAIRERRSDAIFFANRDAIRAAPQLIDRVIPVEWVEEKRTRERSRETLQHAKKAFEDERCIVLFPSGRLAYKDDNNQLTEQEWLTSVVTFARKYDTPIVPAHMTGLNSQLYYLFWKISDELRDITLFNELLNKRGKAFHIKFGDSISPDQLHGSPQDITAALRHHAAYELPQGKPFQLSMSEDEAR